MDAQGRILTRDWRKYNGRTDVVFQPKQMSVDEAPGRVSICESAILFSPQCGQTDVAVACPDMVDSAVEPDVYGFMGQRAMGRSPVAGRRQTQVSGISELFCRVTA